MININSELVKGSREVFVTAKSLSHVNMISNTIKADFAALR